MQHLAPGAPIARNSTENAIYCVWAGEKVQKWHFGHRPQATGLQTKRSRPPVSRGPAAVSRARGGT